MKVLRTIGKINHNTEPGVRVTLYAGTDGYVWAAAPGEDVYKTDTLVGNETIAWGGREWDYQPDPTYANDAAIAFRAWQAGTSS